MDNFPAMRVALESGMIDGYVSERPEGVSASTANKNFKIAEEGSPEQIFNNPKQERTREFLKRTLNQNS